MLIFKYNCEINVVDKLMAKDIVTLNFNMLLSEMKFIFIN